MLISSDSDKTGAKKVLGFLHSRTAPIIARMVFG
jgi:hypothetical protein